MEYRLKTDNYKMLSMYRDNLTEAHSYFIPFGIKDDLEGVNELNERYLSSLVTVLNGPWKFKYFGKVSEMPDVIDTDDYEFDSVPVPSMWQFTGYEEPYYLNTRYQFLADPPNFPADCPVGVYVKELELKKRTGSYILTFLGVAGALDIFVNGKYAGYSEGSHNTAEIDVTALLQNGKNEIVAVVHKWCTGTYLECQDMFRNNGIFRDVYLTFHEKSYLTDLHTVATYNADGTYDLNVNLFFSGDEKICARIDFNGESRNVLVKENRAEICFKKLRVKEWSAETPNLYEICISTECEKVRRKIGFKHIEIKGNVFYFNNQKIKLLGVNHHDTDPRKGYYLSPEDMERDVRIMKAYNMNCVRTSHYPPDPIFLDLCDKYGLYVVDEADIECHGAARVKEIRTRIPDGLEWRPLFEDRVMRMYERDKNHASIVMWSLGNESYGIKNHDYCYKLLKKKTDIPIHYEGASRTRRWAYDVISQMYPSQELVKKVADGEGASSKYYEKPYFLCEYAHAMGVGAGQTEDYLKSFYAADNMLGGCVWEFADHAVWHENGKYEYTYGGDHNEEYHDGNFCVDGLFFPERTPHPGAKQIKNCYRPVRAELVSENDNQIKLMFKNHRYFADSEVKIKWTAIDVNGRKQGEFSLALLPQEERKVTLDTGRSYDALILEYYENGKEIAFEQISLRTTLPKILGAGEEAPKVRHSENRIVISFDGGEIVFDKKDGSLKSYKYKNKEYINPTPFGGRTGFDVSVFRAPLDNDIAYRKDWERLCLDTEKSYLVSLDREEKTSNSVILGGKYVLKTNHGKILTYEMTMEIYGNGCMLMEVKCTDCVKIPFAPRFGVSFEMPPEFDNVRFFGLGGDINLPDFKEHAKLGEYSLKVEALREKYIKPQEASMRSDVRFMEACDDFGYGLKFTAIDRPFIFSADHFTPIQCAKATHREDLIRCHTTDIHIDSYMLGAGSASCGPKLKEPYKKDDLKGEVLRFFVEPL